MKTKTRSHKADQAIITRSLNLSSLRSSLEDVLIVIIHYCNQLSSRKDGEEKTLYVYLSHKKDVIFNLSQAYHILMIGVQRISPPPTGFTSFIPHQYSSALWDHINGILHGYTIAEAESRDLTAPHHLCTKLWAL
jgi:hypothetical protein